MVKPTSDKGTHGKYRPLGTQLAAHKKSFREKISIIIVRVYRRIKNSEHLDAKSHEVRRQINLVHCSVSKAYQHG